MNQEEPTMTTQPETLLLAIRALDAAVAGVRTAELNERTERRMHSDALTLKVRELEDTLRNKNRLLRERDIELARENQRFTAVTAENTALRARVDRLELALTERLARQASSDQALRDAETQIAELQRKIQSQCVANAELTDQLARRETAIVDLVLKGY